MKTQNTVIHPNVLANLTAGMDPMKRRAMVLLNQGKNRRWVYGMIWMLWFLILPALGCFLYKTNSTAATAYVLIMGSPLIYAVMLLFYTKVKVWEKEHRSTWEGMVKKYYEHCGILGINPKDAPAIQIAQIELDSAGIVDRLIETQETLGVNELELRRMIRRGDSAENISQIREVISAQEALLETSRPQLRQKMDIARILFSGAFQDTAQKYREMFRLGSERRTNKKVREETITSHPFYAALTK